MNKKITWGIIAVVIVALIIGGFFWLQSYEHTKIVKLDILASCIANSGSKFYGAFWCPHCQNQKAEFSTLFESVAHKLPYVECSTADSNGQLEVCKNEKITIYPTWKFADGSIKEGEISLSELAQKTGCALP